jgi:pilus assembly protein CpaE
MPRITASIVSADETFTKQLSALLRGGPVAVTVATAKPSESEPVDVVFVDGRASGSAATPAIERLRASSPHLAIVMIAQEAQPDLILESMRAGANEFLTWPPHDRTMHEALTRVAARRAVSPGRPAGTILTFFGVKGGVGTTTVAVNCAVDIARLTKRPTVILDLKQGMGEVALFLGVRGRYSVIDAIDNLHRLDGEFLRELLVTHKSGLDILAASDEFERPSPADKAGIEEIIRLLSRQYDHIVIDAGSHLNSCSLAAMYAAETMFLIAYPEVPSMRNGQRILDRMGQLAGGSDRVRILLNRAAEPLPIPMNQMESALGHPIDHTFPSDYRTVSNALNSGVPLALSGNSQVATQFDRFTRRLLDPGAHAHDRRRSPLERIASLW